MFTVLKIVAGVLVALVILALYRIAKQLHFYYFKLSHIPSEGRTHWFWGDFGEIARLEPGEFQTLRQARIGPVFRSSIFFSPRVTLNDPAALKHVLITNSSNYTKSEPVYDVLRTWLGNSVLTVADPSEHWHQRRLLNSAFTVPAVRDLLPIFDAQVDILVSKWVNASKAGTVVTAHADLTKMTVDVIGLTALNLDFKAQTQSPAEAEKSLSSVFKQILMTFGLNPLMLLPFGLGMKIPIPLNIRRRRLIRSLDEKVDAMIAQRRQAIEQEGDSGAVKRRTILDLLLAMRDDEGHALSTEQLRGQALTFLVAGHETTSTALAWTLNLLSENRSAQLKAQEEIDAMYGPYRGQDIHPTHDELDRLPYVSAVLKESLRHRPPVPVLIRHAENDDTVAGRWFIPKGTTIVIGIYPLHHNPALWDRPEEYIPERWLEHIEGVNEKYLPFLAGPRNCIGHRFAWLEAKLTLVKLLHRLSFAPVPDSKITRKLFITMRPMPDVNLIVTERPVAA